MKPIPAETRRAVLLAIAGGELVRSIAQRFGCSESWVRRVRQQFRENGKTAAETKRRRVPEWRRFEKQIRTLVSRNPAITLRQMEQRLGGALSRQTLSVAMRTLGLSGKPQKKESER